MVTHVTRPGARAPARFRVNVLALAVLASFGSLGVSDAAEDKVPAGRPSLVERLRKDDVLVFVGAHPDDETLLGPVLAYCADHCREVVVVSLTRGEAGYNLGREDLTRTLAQVRTAEFEAAVRKLGGTPVMYDYVNGLSRAHPRGLAVQEPQEAAFQRWRAQGDNKQTSESAYARWTQEAGDPAPLLQELFRKKGVTIVTTLDPQVGVSRHPEHVAASEAARRAVDAGRAPNGQKLSLYYLWGQRQAPESAHRVKTADLNARAEGKDYLRVALESHACYESQRGVRDSEKATRNIGPGVDECFLQLAGN
jgi:LmbE family N-acetylglucosaminyl deacetylase